MRRICRRQAVFKKLIAKRRRGEEECTSPEVAGQVAWPSRRPNRRGQVLRSCAQRAWCASRSSQRAVLPIVNVRIAILSSPRRSSIVFPDTSRAAKKRAHGHQETGLAACFLIFAMRTLHLVANRANAARRFRHQMAFGYQQSVVPIMQYRQCPRSAAASWFLAARAKTRCAHLPAQIRPLEAGSLSGPLNLVNAPTCGLERPVRRRAPSPQDRASHLWTRPAKRDRASPHPLVGNISKAARSTRQDRKSVV